METTEAWVLYAGEDPKLPRPGSLERERISFSSIEQDEILIEPLIGSWEANMAHAIQRSPVDVAAQRGEPKIVLGNSGVARVLKAGSDVKGFKEGDICILFNGLWDEHGYMRMAYAYDAPNTIGLLAKRTKVKHNGLLKVPENSRRSLEQWSAFSLRYLTAWNNWNVACGAYRLQMNESDKPRPAVWGWGGGTTLAEIALAKLQGCDVVMISSNPHHLKTIERMGIDALDFHNFPNLNFNEKRYATDKDYREGYLESERAFLNIVKERTGGDGVSIFVEFIGEPVTRASLLALGRQGVLTTAGWKKGLKTNTIRPIECINRHIHIHTHYARYTDGPTALEFAEKNDWLPPIEEPVTPWDDIPLLVDRYQNGECKSYFPTYAVNGLD